MKLSAVLLAAMVAAPSAAAQEQGPVDSVALRFAWPVGMTARVEQEWSRVQATPLKRDSTSLKSAYRLRVAAHPRGRVVEIDSFVVIPSPDQRLGATPEAEQLFARLGSMMPSYVVTAEGEFIEVSDLQRMKAAIDTMLSPVRRQIDSAPPQLRALLANMTSREALTAAAAQEWNLIAGTWVGADWEVGAAYEHSAEEPIAYLPGQQVRMNYEFAATSRVPCTEGEQELHCVELFMRSAPDSAAFQDLLRSVLGQIAPGQRGMIEALKNMRAVNELTVIAEPGTLRPYSTELIKLVEVSINPGGGEQAGTTTRLDRRAARYTYRP